MASIAVTINTGVGSSFGLDPMFGISYLGSNDCVLPMVTEVSGDGGSTWTQIYTDNTSSAFAGHMYLPNHFLSTRANSVLRVRDSGGTVSPYYTSLLALGTIINNGWAVGNINVGDYVTFYLSGCGDTINSDSQLFLIKGTDAIPISPRLESYGDNYTLSYTWHVDNPLYACDNLTIDVLSHHGVMGSLVGWKRWTRFSTNYSIIDSGSTSIDFTVVSPSAHQSYELDSSSLTVKWKDGSATNGTVDISLSTDNGAAYSALVSGAASTGSNNLNTYVFNVGNSAPWVASTECIIKVVSDRDSCQGVSSVFSLTAAGSGGGTGTTLPSLSFMRNTALTSAFSDDRGFTSSQYVRYKILYRDVSGERSYAKAIERDNAFFVENPPTGLFTQVVLYFVPAAYSSGIDTLEIYRADGNIGAFNISALTTAGNYEVQWGAIRIGNYPKTKWHYAGETFSYNGTDAVYAGVFGYLLHEVTEDYYYIGTIEPEDEGIFVDYHREPRHKLPCLDPEEINYESGVRYSEPYNPSWIKPESFVLVRDGDGDNITGLASQYGNLLVFKDNSMHRYAIQGVDVPMTRYDEISPDVGCIAPNTLITVNNVVYFLSWQGFMRYDNNKIENADGAFGEELRMRLHSISSGSQARYGEIYHSSAAYDQAHKEIWLNVPTYGDPRYGEWDTEYQGYKDQYEWRKGNIFVISPEKGYATKFSYTLYNSDGHIVYVTEGDAVVRDKTVFQTGKLYYTNSIGELRSGDIVPKYPVYLNSNTLNTPSGVYLESPTEEDYDEEFIYTYDGLGAVTYGLWQKPIPSLIGTKVFTGDQTSLIARVRKFVMNMFRSQSAEVIFRTKDIANTQTQKDTPLIDEHFTFANSASSADVVAAVPRPSRTIDSFFDTPGKPVQIAIDIETTGRAELDTLVLHWRPIHSYLE